MTMKPSSSRWRLIATSLATFLLVCAAPLWAADSTLEESQASSAAPRSETPRESAGPGNNSPVSIGPKAQAHFVKPGNATTFAFNVTNHGSAGTFVILNASAAPAGWSRALDHHRLHLRAGQTAIVHLEVRAPATPLGLAAAAIDVTAAPADEPNAEDLAATLTVMGPL